MRVDSPSGPSIAESLEYAMAQRQAEETYRLAALSDIRRAGESEGLAYRSHTGVLQIYGIPQYVDERQAVSAVELLMQTMREYFATDGESLGRPQHMYAGYCGLGPSRCLILVAVAGQNTYFGFGQFLANPDRYYYYPYTVPRVLAGDDTPSMVLGRTIRQCLEAYRYAPETARPTSPSFRPNFPSTPYATFDPAEPGGDRTVLYDPRSVEDCIQRFTNTANFGGEPRPPTTPEGSGDS